MITPLEHTDATRLRDRLAEIEAEQAALEAELAIFHAEYARRVLSVLARGTASRDAATAPEPRAVPARPTRDLKRAFREAAKRMHPDLAPTDEARGHAEAFMKRLNDAYRAGDAEAIADLVRQWDASPFAPAGADEGARRVAALQAAVARAQRRLDELRGSELAQMLERAMASAAAGEDHVATLRHHAELALADARARLAALEARG